MQGVEEMRIPIVLGVTGHRDLPPEDALLIKAALCERFEKLKKKYPHSPIKVFSGLAEGADRWVANAALEAGFQLVATLPMEQSDYEQDFGTPQSLDEFRQLLERSESSLVVEQDAVTLRMGAVRESGYLALGRYIARHANIVIALWDGVPGKVMPDGSLHVPVGGTADVVRMCREGIESDSFERFDLPEKTFVEHLLVRRMSGNTPQDQVGQWATGHEADEPREIAAVLCSIDEFNAAVEKISPSKIGESRDWLLGRSPPQAVVDALAQPLAVFAAADAAAGERQAQRASAIRWVSGMALVSIACQQIYSGPQMRWGWLVAHIGLAILAFLLYRWLFKGSSPRERQYLDWRALAEALRVQAFWLASGVRQQVSDHYLFGDMRELGWIRKAARNAAFVVSPLMGAESLAWVGDAWLKDQRNYFGKKSPENAAKGKWFGRFAFTAFSLALFITATTLVAHLAGVAMLRLNFLLLASAMCFVVVVALEAYAEQMAFKEQAARYRVMGDAYRVAFDRFGKCLADGDIARARGVLVLIGKEALAENAGWLSLHRQRQFKLNVN